MVGDCGMLKEKIVSQSYHRIYSKAVKLLPAEITEVLFFCCCAGCKVQEMEETQENRSGDFDQTTKCPKIFYSLQA